MEDYFCLTGSFGAKLFEMKIFNTHTYIYIYIKVYEFIDLNNFSKNKSRSSYKHFSWLIFKQMMKQDNNK